MIVNYLHSTRGLAIIGLKYLLIDLIALHMTPLVHQFSASSALSNERGRTTVNCHPFCEWTGLVYIVEHDVWSRERQQEVDR